MTLSPSLRAAERLRDERWNRDRWIRERMHWRACIFRQYVHLLPGETILDLGTGSGRFTEELKTVSREENPITAITLERANALQGQRFDYVVAQEIADRASLKELLTILRQTLNPGGTFVVFLRNRGRIGSPAALERILQEHGFLRTRAHYTDFLYSWTPRFLLPLLRGISVILENMPLQRQGARCIWIAGQAPPPLRERHSVSLAHDQKLHQAVSIVVPCHNEEMNIGPLIAGLKAFYDPYIREFILVNDNSTDRTQGVMESLHREDPRVHIIKRSPPGGVGYALKDGIAAATSSYILTMDGDFTLLLPELRDLFDTMAKDDIDIVYGSRFSPESILLDYPLPKILSNRLFHLLARMLLRKPIRDVTNNLKLMKLDVARKLHLTEPHFAVNAEIGLQPILMGYNFKEVPISWINRSADMGVSSFKLAKVGRGYLRVLWRMVRETMFGARALS